MVVEVIENPKSFKTLRRRIDGESASGTAQIVRVRIRLLDESEAEGDDGRDAVSDWIVQKVTSHCLMGNLISGRALQTVQRTASRLRQARKTKNLEVLGKHAEGDFAALHLELGDAARKTHPVEKDDPK